MLRKHVTSVTLFDNSSQTAKMAAAQGSTGRLSGGRVALTVGSNLLLARVDRRVADAEKRKPAVSARLRGRDSNPNFLVQSQASYR